MTLDPVTSAKISGYRPRDAEAEWDWVAEPVRQVVAAAAPMGVYDVERLLHVTARLAIWATRRGLPLDPEVWLRHETIDEFVLTGCHDVAPGSAQTYRSWLRHMRAGLAWAQRGEQSPPPMAAPRGVTPPYSPAELAGLRAWAERLTGQARDDGLALLALTAGCGLTPGELAAIRGTEVRVLTSGTVLVENPQVDRLVVARCTWEAVLADAARAAGPQYLFRPGRSTPHAKNLVGSWSLRHRPTGGLPQVSARRLRSCWIVELLTARIDPAVVAAAAGLASPASLARFQHFVPVLDGPTQARLLRGRR